MMELNKIGLDFIKSYEGLRLTAYKALSTEKYWTIGYGHYGSDVRQGQTITKDQADKLFEKDVQRFENVVNNLVKVELTQDQFNALVSFTYNVGEGALKSSDLLKKLNSGDYKGASAEFPRWNKSDGKIIQGLVNRRKKERELFDKSTPTKSQPKQANKKTSTPSTYKIKSGDTLSEIASKYGTTVKNLQNLNGIKNPNNIQAGKTIKLSGSPSPSYKSYKIKSGDTLSGIASKNQTTVAKLQSINSISNPNKIYAGQTIKVPK